MMYAVKELPSVTKVIANFTVSFCAKLSFKLSSLNYLVTCQKSDQVVKKKNDNVDNN